MRGRTPELTRAAAGYSVPLCAFPAISSGYPRGYPSATSRLEPIERKRRISRSPSASGPQTHSAGRQSSASRQGGRRGIFVK